MSQLEVVTRGLLARGALDLPLPGAGGTAARHRALLDFAVGDLSLARVVEAHCDAVAILAEAGLVAAPGQLYGVWASESPTAPLTLEHGDARRGAHLHGVKRYASGATFLDAALVTARAGDDALLVEVPLRGPGIGVDGASWKSPAFADTGTATVTFDATPTRRVVGPPGFYLTRPGFWHGAMGPAACWAGGAIGLVHAAHALRREDPHSRAQLGALAASEWGLRALLDQVGAEIDGDPLDHARVGMRRALSLRHLVERLCTDILDRFGRATGPQLLAFDEACVKRHAELALYIRQCHGERDLEALASSS